MVLRLQCHLLSNPVGGPPSPSPLVVGEMLSGSGPLRAVPVAVFHASENLTFRCVLAYSPSVSNCGCAKCLFSLMASGQMCWEARGHSGFSAFLAHQVG